MSPDIKGHLSYVNAAHNTPYGIISSHWQKKSGYWTWKIHIPAGASAVLTLPKGITEVTEDGKPLKEKAEEMLERGSGNYEFRARLVDWLSSKRLVSKYSQ